MIGRRARAGGTLGAVRACGRWAAVVASKPRGFQGRVPGEGCWRFPPAEARTGLGGGVGLHAGQGEDAARGPAVSDLGLARGVWPNVATRVLYPHLAHFDNT